jgi:hypothetical protein
MKKISQDINHYDILDKYVNTKLVEFEDRYGTSRYAAMSGDLKGAIANMLGSVKYEHPDTYLKLLEMIQC